MKVLNALGLVTRHQAREDAKFRVTASVKHNEAKIDNLTNENKKLKKEAARNKEELEECHTKIEVLEDRVDESRELVTKEIELGDKEAVLEAMRKGIAAREAMLGVDEHYKYLEGYADGMIDGLQNAHDVSSQDRKSLAEVASAAASIRT